MTKKLLFPQLYQIIGSKKREVVLATSISVTADSKALQKVLYIRYLVQFQVNQEVKALIDSASKVNVMTSTYRAKLTLTTRTTSIETQKIDGSAL